MPDTKKTNFGLQYKSRHRGDTTAHLLPVSTCGDMMHCAICLRPDNTTCRHVHVMTANDTNEHCGSCHCSGEPATSHDCVTVAHGVARDHATETTVSG